MEQNVIIDSEEFQKIDFYKERSFGEKLSAAFAFIKQNFKPLFKYMSYFVLPLGIIYGLFYQSYIETIMSNAESSSTPRMGIFLIGLIFSFCYWCVNAMLYALMIVYNDSPDGLNSVSDSDVWRQFRVCLVKSIKMGLSLMFLIILFGLIGAVLSMAFFPLLFLFILACFLSFVLLALVNPTYMFDDLGILSSVSEGITLAFNTFWSTLGLMIVTVLITSVLTFAAEVPYYIVFMVNGIVGGSLSDVSIFMKVFLALLMAVAMCIQLYSTSIITYALCYQYGHAAEIMDGVSVTNAIDDFDSLAEKKSDDGIVFGKSTNDDVPAAGNKDKEDIFEDISDFDKLGKQ